MRRPGSKQRRIVILFLAILTFGIAYYGGNRYPTSDLPQISGILLRPAAPVPEFELEDHHNEPFSSKQLEDHWNLLALDPSSQADAFLRLIQIHNRLALDPKQQQQTRFIHLSKENSEKPILGTDQLDKNFLVLSGEPDRVAEIFKRFGVEPDSDHFTLYLIDPESRIQALFTDTQDAATIAEDFNTLFTH